MSRDRLISEDYWDHMARKQDGKVRGYKCPEWFEDCNFEFDADREQVMDHLETHHNLASDGVMIVYLCSVCEWANRRRSKVAEHVRHVHPERLPDTHVDAEADESAESEPETWEPWGEP